MHHYPDGRHPRQTRFQTTLHNLYRSLSTYLLPSDYNISDIAADAPNATYTTAAQTVTFKNAEVRDYHLSVYDTIARDAGMDLSSDVTIAITTDIDSNSRPIGDAFDIGADEAMLPIFRSVGPGTTADLQQGTDSGGIEAV